MPKGLYQYKNGVFNIEAYREWADKHGPNVEIYEDGHYFRLDHFIPDPTLVDDFFFFGEDGYSKAYSKKMYLEMESLINELPYIAEYMCPYKAKNEFFNKVWIF